MSLDFYKKALPYKLLHKTSIKNKFIIFFLFIGFLSTSIILIPLYKRAASIITDRINFSAEKNLNSISESLMQKFEEINEISTYIYLTPEVIQSISSDRNNKSVDIIAEMSSLDKVLETYYMTDVRKTSKFPRLYILNRPEYSMYNFSNKVFDLTRIQSEKWYLSLPEKSRYSIAGLSSIELPTGKIDSIRFAKKIFALNRQDVPFLGLLTIDIDVQEFNKLLNYYRLTRNSSLFIINSENTVQLSSEAGQLGQNLNSESYIETIRSYTNSSTSFKSKIDGNEVLISYNKIKELGWTIVSVSKTDELFGELIVFRRAVYVVCIICILLSIIFALILSENIMYPIRKLMKSMRLVQDGNFEINLEYGRNDEFSYLIDSYNRMIHEIKDLINKLYITEADKKEAELLALQAQINPHFLYNTLDLVNWTALSNNVPEISTMATALSDFFRYSLSNGRSIIPLGDEISQVKSYLLIQNLRFKDKLDYRINFPPELSNYLIVKLVLQPIVENAIIHGIERRRGKGIVDITVEKIGDWLKIRISDDGTGGNIEKMNAMLAGPKNSGISKAFGIRNVNERIKQTFGNEFGIEFQDNIPTGVTATIIIPALEKLEGYHDKNDYSR